MLTDGTARFSRYLTAGWQTSKLRVADAGFEVGGDRLELGPGGLVHVKATPPRRFWNAGDEDLVLLLIGGKDGYVERDGHTVDPADEERRRAFSAGDLDAIRRHPR